MGGCRSFAAESCTLLGMALSGDRSAKAGLRLPAANRLVNAIYQSHGRVKTISSHRDHRI